MSVTALFEFATIVAFAIVLLGGRDKRESGWKMVSSLLAINAVCQIIAMAFVVCFPFEYFFASIR